MNVQKQPRFRYTEKEWKRIYDNLTKEGYRNQSAFVRSRINEIHVSVTNGQLLFDDCSKKNYTVGLDEMTLLKITEISIITKKPFGSIVKKLILDPLLHQHS